MLSHVTFWVKGFSLVNSRVQAVLGIGTVIPTLPSYFKFELRRKTNQLPFYEEQILPVHQYLQHQL